MRNAEDVVPYGRSVIARSVATKQSNGMGLLDCFGGKPPRNDGARRDAEDVVPYGNERLFVVTQCCHFDRSAAGT